MKKALLVGLMFAGTAQAEYFDGNELLNRLNDDGYVLPMVGLGYIMGVADTVAGVNVCMPNNVQSGQAKDMVHQYLKNNPSIRHFSADRIVVHVLKAAWPCSNAKSKV